MTQSGQDFEMHAGERYAIRFPSVDIPVNSDDPSTPSDLSAYAVVRWALSAIDESGTYSTEPLFEKLSTNPQPISGGNEIDFSNGTGTNDIAEVQLLNADTNTLQAGDYHQELEGVDGDGQPTVLAVGTITILANVENA